MPAIPRSSGSSRRRALLALAGMAFATRARRSPLTPALFGLSGAATVVGGILVGVYAVAYLRLLTS